jgi:LPS-assembly protein
MNRNAETPNAERGQAMKRALLHMLLPALLLQAQPVLAQGDAKVTESQSAENQDSESLEIENKGAESRSPDVDRITFDVRLNSERGGGRVTGWAGNIELQEGQYLLATEGVELKYRDLILQADSARVDLPTNLLTAEGNVILDEGPQRLTGDTLEYDLSTHTGRVSQATAYVDPDYYFSGAQIAKVGDRTFTINDGVFTSCEQDVPSWSIHLRDARITMDEYARIKHARLKFKHVPVLYMPYMLWPATTERTTGFLVPKPGYSERQGLHVDLAYYKTLGRSADATFYADLSTEGYFGFGNEIRYRTSESTEGYFRAYYLFEPVESSMKFFNEATNFDPTRRPGDDRWKIEFYHESKNLWGKFRGVVNYQQYSDFDYLLDFERDVRRQTRPVVYSNAFLTRSAGQYSFNAMIDQRDRIQSLGNEDVRRQLPELEFRLRPTRLGNTQFYFSLDSAAHYLSVEQIRNETITEVDSMTGELTTRVETTSTFDEQYARGHVAPTLSIPLSSLPWLSAKLELGGRATFYGKSFRLETDPETDAVSRVGFVGGSRSRIVPEGSLEVIGPVFTKIFEKSGGRFAKFKHIIEPRATYSYVDTYEDQQAIFNFDEIDSLISSNAVTFAFVNRLMGKPSDPDQGGAIEIGSFELRQSYSLDDEMPLQRVTKTSPSTEIDGMTIPAMTNIRKSTEGPIRAILRINPSRLTTVRADLRYSTLSSQIRSLSFTGSKTFGGTKTPTGGRVGGHRVGVTWNTNWSELGKKTSDQVRLFTRFSLFRDRLTFDAQASLNLEPLPNAKSLTQQRYVLKWKAQCYDWQLELRETTVRGIDDRDLLFSLNLKNVGTFLDLNESF